MSLFCDKYTVTEKKTLAKDIYSVTVKAPDAVKAAKVGQFVTITAEGFSLRRPISICEIDRAKGTLRFVFEVRGKGTEQIARVNAGETLDILAPLGNGFRIPDSKRVIAVGGGIGVPPLLGIAKTSRELCTAILGFRSYEKIILTEEFKAFGSNTIICTDDGSVGYHGVVTQPLAEELDKGEVGAVLACGPEPMLRAIVKLCLERDVPCQVSMEQRMGCGVGACVGCTCVLDRGGKDYYARVCKDGPVFDAKEVKFDG
ncbi:MAG: dihydroorotate dehydrogenase electron transfer subunit [Oscillospiraceae bacterium]|nr:dihydroorotate dehydrogenase electron transfer subunit [Oscillospiraceae bacterium]